MNRVFGMYFESDLKVMLQGKIPAFLSSSDGSFSWAAAVMVNFEMTATRMVRTILSSVVDTVTVA